MDQPENVHLHAAEIAIHFNRPAPLRHLASATFHGVLGHALRDIDPEAVPLFFKPGAVADELCPYVIQPLHFDERMADTLGLRIVSFDSEHAALPRFIAALPGCVGRPFGMSGAYITRVSHTPVLPHIRFRDHQKQWETQTVHLLTPANMTYHGQPLNPERFCLHAFISAGIRRIEDIAARFWQCSLPEALSDPATVQSDASVSHVKLGWVSPRRQSTSQDKSVTLGGLVGTFDILHPSTALLFLLDLLYWTNIGKKTSYGCGTIAVTPSKQVRLRD